MSVIFINKGRLEGINVLLCATGVCQAISINLMQSSNIYACDVARGLLAILEVAMPYGLHVLA